MMPMSQARKLKRRHKTQFQSLACRLQNEVRSLNQKVEHLTSLLNARTAERDQLRYRVEAHNRLMDRVRDQARKQFQDQQGKAASPAKP